jgi:hypothetical protein
MKTAIVAADTYVGAAISLRVRDPVSRLLKTSIKHRENSALFP